MASNAPPTIEELTNEVTSGFIGNHDLVNLEEEEELATAISNDRPA